MIEVLVVIEAPHFYAGVIAQNGRVVEVAPILCRHIKRGWSGEQLAAYCKRQGWKWDRVSTTES